jgi:hypothetical protein
MAASAAAMASLPTLRRIIVRPPETLVACATRALIQPFPTFSEIYAAALKALAHDVSMARRDRPLAVGG